MSDRDGDNPEEVRKKRAVICQPIYSDVPHPDWIKECGCYPGHMCREAEGIYQQLVDMGNVENSRTEDRAENLRLRGLLKVHIPSVEVPQ